jgi:TonB family protein
MSKGIADIPRPVERALPPKEPPSVLDSREILAEFEAAARSGIPERVEEREALGEPKASSVALRLTAIPLGLAFAFAIFLFIGWLQPTLRGGERVAMPALIQFRVADTEQPPPPPPQEQPAEEPERKVRQRPAETRRRAAPRSQLASRPQLDLGLTPMALMPGAGAGVGVNLSFDTAEIGIDGRRMQDEAELRVARRRRKEIEAREMSYQFGGAGNGALSQFAEPRLIMQVKPSYPPDAREKKKEGEVWVKILVSKVGDVREIEITWADPEGFFEQAVRDAVSRWRFAPGKDDEGNPVEMWVVAGLEFDLEAS